MPFFVNSFRWTFFVRLPARFSESPGQTRQAAVVAVPSFKAAIEMLASGKLDAFATNKAVLFQMADTLPGARVLEGRWGTEHLAIAVPQGRAAGQSGSSRRVQSPDRRRA